MKYNLSIITFLLLFSIQVNSQTPQKQVYNIEVNAPAQVGSMAYLANYWEDRTYIIDSTRVSDEGAFAFSKNEQLPTGQYLLYIKPDIQLNLLLDENEQSDIKITIAEDIISSKITGSKDTQLFWEYIIKRNQQDAENAELISKIKARESDKVAKQEAIDEYVRLTKEIDKYTTDQINEHQGSWFSTYIKAMNPITAPHIYPSSREEMVENARYVSNHYFDNIDLTNVDMWRTSIFTSNIDNYLSEWVVQSLDTIAEKSSWLVAQTQRNDVAFEKMLSYLTNKSTNSNVMGEENIWARLAEDYIFDKEVSWISAEQLNSLKAEYELIKLNRIGMKAQNLRMQTVAGDTINTNDIEAEYTVLYFYSTICHHCRVEIPLLKKDFYDKHKNEGVKVIAINVEHEQNGWESFVKEKEMEEWVNVSDPDFKSGYWLKYNTQGTPSLYLLDKNKTIIAKKINVESLIKLFDRIKE